MKKSKNDAAQAAGCCLLTLLCFPFAVIFSLVKDYNKSRRGRH